ncbi:MAG: GMP/IMP nucleotidase YrfG [Gammaproteobacteria bacterium]|nr:GMP/IMP nucleotidase YrfG [Gammaproteobacteria bacterium]
MLNWEQIDHVLLDMDGTLLDLRFDTEFWLEHLPGRYADANELSHDEALAHIRTRMHALSGQLGWYCIDEWSSALGLDVVALKRELAEGIRYRDTAVAFLEALAATDKRALIVTNAHPETVGIKLHRTGLDRYVDGVVSSHDYGAAKEDQSFWHDLQANHVFEPDRTLFIDDNLPVLRAARQFGIAHLLAVSHPDSGQAAKDTEEFDAIQWFTEIMPIARGNSE